ncbi:MAG: type I-B CRISPR-associated protein Cas8b1/Cst1 [Bacillota bacterium]
MRRCVFTGESAVAVSLDVNDKLDPGRTFRQHIPMLTGEGVINFFPYGDAGLPVSGKALFAIQALPLGCAKVEGKLLAVHCDDRDLMIDFARQFLENNRKAIHTVQLAGEKKLPEAPHRTTTLLIDQLLRLEKERRDAAFERPVSITAYHFSNSGQGATMAIYHLPMEVTGFLIAAVNSKYRDDWDKLTARGWEISRSKKGSGDDEFRPQFNVLYEDLFSLPEESHRFIRRYFLRVPERSKLRAGDPRSTYSIRNEADLVSWGLTELFLRKVVSMDKQRIEQIRTLGESLAQYVIGENDRRFFHTFLRAPRYDVLRAALIRASLGLLRQGKEPIIRFDPFIEVFEEGEDLPYSDWRLARDLLLIRMIECLYDAKWLQANEDVLYDEEEVDSGLTS